MKFESVFVLVQFPDDSVPMSMSLHPETAREFGLSRGDCIRDKERYWAVLTANSRRIIRLCDYEIERRSEEHH